MLAVKTVAAAVRFYDETLHLMKSGMSKNKALRDQGRQHRSLEMIRHLVDLRKTDDEMFEKV